MNFNTVDVDWSYLLDRLEHLMDLGEEYLTRELSENALDPDLFTTTLAFRWQQEKQSGYFYPIAFPDLPDHRDLIGIDHALQRLRQNTMQFVHGVPANNILLRGACGSGKSSAIKGLLNEFGAANLRLIEVRKENLFQLSTITMLLRPLPYRFVLFCDDLSCDELEADYREIKGLLEGGLEARPDNVIIYATSNRPQLIPKPWEDNSDREIHPKEAVAEKLSLYDPFGLTLSFYPATEETYLEIIRHLAKQRKLVIAPKTLDSEALQWTIMRGSRSGRVARQFIDDLTGRLLLAQTPESHIPPA
jgi:uncharacterized protein